MAKTLKNGLSMIEMNPLNHNWSDFMILMGLTLHQFQKKLLLSKINKDILNWLLATNEQDKIHPIISYRCFNQKIIYILA